MKNIATLFKRLAIILVTGIFASGSAAVEPTKQGSMWAGGSIDFPIRYDHLDTWYVKLNVSPRFGYFIGDGQDLHGGIDFETPNGVTVPAFYWGFSIGSTCYYDTKKHIYPYAGVELNAHMVNLRIFQLDAAFRFPIGVLFMVADNVAIDIGIPVEIYFTSNSRTIFDKVVITPGYFGLRGFF